MALFSPFAPAFLVMLFELVILELISSREFKRGFIVV